MEKEGVIDLPPKQKNTYKGKNNNNTQQQEPIHVDRTPVEGDIRELLPLTLYIACTKDSHGRWRYYMNQYHMLQAKTVFGSQLRYFIRSKGRDLGCMQFSASAWAVIVRDRWIGWRKEDKGWLHLIVNNKRFLIFPWVRVQNLASKSLSLAAKQIQKDWKNEYGYAPVLLETFVDLHYFSGTCYQAANWIYLGLTRGTGRTAKQGISLSKKAIYAYPLKKHFRAYLKGDLSLPGGGS